jgi:hypothetical protein
MPPIESSVPARIATRCTRFADERPGEHGAGAGEGRADQHRGAEAASEDGRIVVRVAREAGDPGNHGHGQQPGAA